MIKWILMIYCVGGCSSMFPLEHPIRVDAYPSEKACVEAGEYITAKDHARYPESTFEYSCLSEKDRGPGKRRE